MIFDYHNLPHNGFLSEVFLGRPLTREYQDVRVESVIRESAQKQHTISSFARKKAAFVSLLFVVVGVLVVFFRVKDLYGALPLILFYLTLVVNTYFSVRLFSSVIAQDDLAQNCVDAVLFLLYLFLAWSLALSGFFVYVATVLFLVSCFKYALLLGSFSHSVLLKRKLVVNVLASIACVLALGGILFGYGYVAVWTWTTLFIIGNVVLFFVWPLYKFDSPLS